MRSVFSPRWCAANYPTSRGRVSFERLRSEPVRLASSLEQLRFLPQDLDGQLDRPQVGVQAQDGYAQGEFTVDLGRGEEDPAVPLHGVDQPPVEGIRISTLGEV